MKFLEFFKDGTGQFSSSRLFMLLVCISAIIDWQHAIWTVGLWSPSFQTVGMILGVLGFKVAQTYQENK